MPGSAETEAYTDFPYTGKDSHPPNYYYYYISYIIIIIIR